MRKPLTREVNSPMRCFFAGQISHVGSSVLWILLGRRGRVTSAWLDEKMAPEVRAQFLRFLLVGAFNTAFGYAVFALLLWVGLPNAGALALSTVAGVLFNFQTTGRLVFANQGWRQLPRFLIGYGAVFVINLGLLDALVAIGLSAYVAQLFILPVAVVISFIISKIFVFRSQS